MNLSICFICLLRCTATCDVLCLQCAAQRECWHFTVACLQHWWRCFLTLGCSSSPTMSLKSCWLHHPKLETQEVSGGRTHYPSCLSHHVRSQLVVSWLFFTSPFKEIWGAWSAAVEQELSAKQSHTRLTSSRRDCRWEALRQPDFTLDRWALLQRVSRLQRNIFGVFRLHLLCFPCRCGVIEACWTAWRR